MEEPVRVDLRFPRSGQRLEVTLPRRVVTSATPHVERDWPANDRPALIVVNDRGRTDAQH